MWLVLSLQTLMWECKIDPLSKLLQRRLAVHGHSAGRPVQFACAGQHVRGVPSMKLDLEHVYCPARGYVAFAVAQKIVADAGMANAFFLREAS